MHPYKTTTAQVPVEAPIVTPEEAHALCDELIATMDALIETVERETELVRGGKLLEAGALAPEKAKLSQVYTTRMLKVKRNTEPLKAMIPDALRELQKRHDLFRSLLKINLAVLATAKEVSSDIMSTLAATVGKTRKTNGYSADARLPQERKFMTEGVALDRGI